MAEQDTSDFVNSLVEKLAFGKPAQILISRIGSPEESLVLSISKNPFAKEGSEISIANETVSLYDALIGVYKAMGGTDDLEVTIQ